MIKKSTLAAVVASIAASPLAYAEGFYLGLATGESNLEAQNQDLGTETAIIIKSGYQYNDYFAIELAYNHLGEIEESESIGNSYSTFSINKSHEFESYGLAAIGFIPVSTMFNLYGKIGIETWEVEFKDSMSYTGYLFSPISWSESYSYEADGTDFYFGIGANLIIAQSYEINLNYDIHSWEENNAEWDTDVISLGFNYRF